MTEPFNIRDAIACIKPVLDPESSGAPEVPLPPDEMPVLTPLGADFAIAYLVDNGNEFVHVQERHLVQLDGRRDRLARLGLHNLKRLAGERMEVRAYNRIFAVFLDGHFEASLSLLNTLWDETLAGMVSGGVVLAMPARDVLAFCGADDERGIRELRELVDRVWADGTPDHAISRDLFRRHEQRWKRLNPPRRF